MAETPFDFSSTEQNKPGSTPKPGADFNKMFDSLNAETTDNMMQERPLSLTERANAPVGPKSMVYTPDSSLDMYRYQEGFEGDKFNPLDTSNYEKWAAKETMGSALSKGFDSFAYKFGNTFVDYWKGYGRMADALISMDWDKMKPDEATLAEQYYQDQIDMNRNFVFQQPGTEDDIFSKRTMSEFIGNAGFALGTFAGLGLEIAADIAITAASGGAGAVSFAGLGAKAVGKKAAETTAKSGYRFADVLTDLGKGFSYGNRGADELAAAGNIVKQIDQASDIAKASKSVSRSAMEETFNIFSNNLLNITKSKNLGELGANILKGTPLLGTGIRAGEKFAAASKAGANTMQLLGIGAQGVRRVAQELNMSATEASFEAVTSYGDTLDKMVQQYKVDNQGAVPSAEEFEDMKSLAMKASASNYNTNLALLLATNKLQFGNLFNKFIPANKFMSEAVENLLVVESKAGSGLFKKGVLGAYGLVGEVAKNFGKKEAAYQMSKAFAKDFLQFELSEGLQENLQETSAAAWRDYYAGQFNGVEMSLSQAFEEGLSEQFSKQGLKTFLMGALTGSIIRVPTAAATKSLDAANRAVVNKQYKDNPDANPLTLAEKQLDEDIRTLNALFKQAHEGKFKDKMFNFAAQVDAAQEQSEAASKGLRYEFENGKDNALLSAISAAQRTNSINVLYRAVKDMGTNMTPEDFEKSFGIKLEDTKYSTPSQFSEAVAKDIKKYSETIDGLRAKVKSSLADPSIYEKGSSNRYVAAALRNAQEDAIQVIAMNAIKGDMTAKRAQQVASDLRSVPAFASSSDFALRVLTNPAAIEGELGNVKGEIRILQENLNAEGLDAATKKDIQEQIDLKEKEYQLIKTWSSFWESREGITGYDREEKPVIGKILTSVFTGKRIDKKQTVKDENGNDVETVDVTYDPADAEVVETFRQLMNIKNKQAKNNTEISEQDMRDGFQKIYDYIRLDQDTKDYMKSVDVLMNPDHYKQMLQRITDGKFKSNLIGFVDTIFAIHMKLAKELIDGLGITNMKDIADIYNTLANTSNESENFKNLATLISNPDLGIEHQQYAAKLNDALVEELKKKTEELKEKYKPEEVVDTISEEDLKKIKEDGVLDTTIRNLIADKLSRGLALAANEQEVYNLHKAEIDAEVAKPVSNTTAPTELEVTTSETIPEAVDEAPVIVVGPDGEETIETPTPVAPTITQPETTVDKQDFLNKHVGRVVIINGVQGVLIKFNDQRYEVETQNRIYEFSFEDIETFKAASTLSPTIEKYNVTDVTETDVTVNDVPYTINTDEKGNVVSVSPKNYPDQQITNERLLVAVEVARNRESIQNPVQNEAIIAELQKNLPDVDKLLNTIWELNLTDTIADALDKLYDNKPLTSQEALQTALWLSDVFDRISRLIQAGNTPQENEAILSAYNTAEIINSLLYNLNNITTNYNEDTKAATSIEQVESNVSTKRDKKRLAKQDPKPATQAVTPAPEPVITEPSLPDTPADLTSILGAMLPETAVEQETAFAPTGNAEEGFNVIDRNNNVVNPEKFNSQEEAVNLAESLNNTNANFEFVQQLLGPVSETVTMELYTKMLGAAERSMTLYNKRAGTSFTTLAEYYKTPDGKRLINGIKESILTGKAVRYNKKKAAVTVTAPETQVTLFERPSDGRAASLTLAGLEELYAKVVEFRDATLQNSNNLSKFVETESTAPISVSETSILSKLQEITACFS